MGKVENILYIIICLLICILPFAGMTVAATSATTENRALAGFPEFWENDSWNQEYLAELGAYFEDHFAFRQVFVMADSVIQSRAFGVSNMDTVITGSDGWLYYASTLKDYLGERTLSEKGIWNAGNNLSLIQKKVEENGAEFLLTVAPNKNSLYGKHMPYYYRRKISQEKNMTYLKKELVKREIPYADLFAVFEREKEILYLKRDSHWNRKGAVLAYDAMLDYFKLAHETYETVENIRTRDEYGDLNLMIYPLSFAPEWNYTYQKEYTYQYVTDTSSVEDVWIETENPAGTGRLLMFRDSFGNTLLPLMADTFEKAYFSKGTPYNLEQYLERYHPEYVIMEKVERNVDDFAVDPPIMTGTEVMPAENAEAVETATTLEVKESEYDVSCLEIRGILDESFLPETRVYIRMTKDGQAKEYEAFTVSDESSDYGYVLYMKKEQFPAGTVQIDVLTENAKGIKCVKTAVFDIRQLPEATAIGT